MSSALREFTISWGFILLSVIFDCYTIVLLKYRFNQLGNIDLSSIASSWNYILRFFSDYLIWTGVFTFFLGPLFGYIALNRLSLVAAYPISMTLHIIIIYLAGIYFLHEQVTIYKVTGATVMLTGLYIFFWK